MSEPLLRVISADQIPISRRRPVDPDALQGAAAILNDIENRGAPAVLDHAIRLGDLRPGDVHFHDRASLKAAFDRLPRQQQLVLERSAARIRSFADAQRACITDLDVKIEGGRAGHTCLPVQTAGCYAPGGRFPLPSSVLMTAITARAAGVSTVWVSSPRPTDATLAASYVANADGLLAIGGAQAVGALSHGLCGVTPCDMIVGPGNKWVTAAKFLVSDRVGIDMLAGPSELLVLADASADPILIAADLLAQAEHDDDAVPILISTDLQLPALVDAELRRQLETLPTRATATAALRNGFAICASDIASAIAICNSLAPEHLEVMTANADIVSSGLSNAGAMFIGPASAEVFGDYGAGPNHVLPTGGTSRFRAGLSVFTFLRPRSWLNIDSVTQCPASHKDAALLARMEGLEGHARAAESRY